MESPARNGCMMMSCMVLSLRPSVAQSFTINAREGSKSCTPQRTTQEGSRLKPVPENRIADEKAFLGQAQKSVALLQQARAHEIVDLAPAQGAVIESRRRRNSRRETPSSRRSPMTSVSRALASGSSRLLESRGDFPRESASQ